MWSLFCFLCEPSKKYLHRRRVLEDKEVKPDVATASALRLPDIETKVIQLKAVALYCYFTLQGHEHNHT